MSKTRQKLRKSGKISKSFKISLGFFLPNKNAIILVLPFKEINIDQGSPVHPVSEPKGGSTSVTKSERRTKILVSNIRWLNNLLCNKCINCFRSKRVNGSALWFGPYI